MQKTLVVANDIFFIEVKENLRNGHDVLFTINGNSMRPFLSHGDKVLIGVISVDKLSFGKIILAYSNYGYVLHRLVWKDRDNIWLAGDNNLIQLEKVEFENILGYVKYAEIDGRKINVDSRLRVVLAFLWFIMRPLRLVVHKLKKLFRLK